MPPLPHILTRLRVGSPIALLALFLATTNLHADATGTFIGQAKEKHGDFGEKAARFLVQHMPETDKANLSAEFLLENLDLALEARETFPWGKEVPEEIFLNDVLPYAVFDEPRDPWRADFFQKAGDLVKDARTASEAAQILNRDLFKQLKTHYNVKRERVNQSPAESIRQGRATCTGLSIILVDACRAVGIPARAVGTPLWSNKSGNHTWVEIWDKEWKFTGADEYSPKGLNHGWFTRLAAKADAKNPRHAIYATSWNREGGIFPMIWSPRSTAVGGVNVTDRYTGNAQKDHPGIGVRFLAGDERLTRKGWLANEAGELLTAFETKSGTADRNDTPILEVTPGQRYRLVFEIGGRKMGTSLFPIRSAQLEILDIRESDLSPLP